jgi:signal peptidase I
MLTDPRCYLHNEPRRGDVAISAIRTTPGIDFVKRIVGLPGDRIAFKEGRLVINGTPVERRPIGTFEYALDQSQEMPIWLNQYIETLPGGPSYRILLSDEPSSLDAMSEVTVPPDHYFVVGDNRDHSNDSRQLGDIGFVSRDNLTARPKFIYWSRRWARIGTAIE